MHPTPHAHIFSEKLRYMSSVKSGGFTGERSKNMIGAYVSVARHDMETVIARVAFPRTSPSDVMKASYTEAMTSGAAKLAMPFQMRNKGR